MPDLPPEAYDDHFHPPSLPTEVGCLHCQRTYESYLIEWRESEDPSDKLPGMWCCPTPGCTGAGFGFDIFPLDPDYVDPDGRDLGQWCDDECDECDECEAQCTADLDTCCCECCMIERGELEDFDDDEQIDEDCEVVCAGDCGCDDEDGGDEDSNIPLDDLLPVNESVGGDDISFETMIEIEEKLGFRVPRDLPSEARMPPPSSHKRRDHPPLPEDDIPY